MTDVTNDFLKTKMTQKAVTDLLVAELQPLIDECTYNVKRYNVPITLILLYSEHDISNLIIEHIRLSDIRNIIQIKDSYFNFVFLPFTDVEHSFSLINHIEYNVLKDIKVFSSVNAIEPEIFNYFNFINLYLVEISEKDRGNILTY
ncbi:hypothetical protein KKG72_09470 [bacterium]|nr:hypothetical protein [bacterium]MBU1993113.1 hypothetical protein [bacterium]